jgi:hypothetical protein
MLTDKQVRLLRKKLMEGKTQEAAAAATGVSERSARKWQKGLLPSQTKEPRWWRTREDPLAAVWDLLVVPLLEADTKRKLQAKTVLEVLEREQPGEFGEQHLRTLQRRIRDWRALHGPPKEVYFEQRHVPGREGQLDFTHGTELEITIGGVLFVHLLFELVLSYSGWRWVCLAFGETFEALSAGLQGALWALGGAPKVARSDNLSAATHELKGSGGRELTQRFKAVLDHYEMVSTRIKPRKSHENGVAEKAHDVLKTALEQALLVRGSREFSSTNEYAAFVAEVTARLNERERVVRRLTEERPHLLPLPAKPLPAYTTYWPVVRKWSTIRVGNRTYSVPSRLIDHEVEARLHPDAVEVRYNDKTVEWMPRLRGSQAFRIDYRHVIWSLVTKPGAFARYRYREELFPTLIFRRAYDALCGWRGERADVEYVRVLHLAASTMEATVERVLAALLEGGQPFDYVAVKQAAAPEQPPLPLLSVPSVPDLSAYDRLLAGGGQ